MEAKQANDRLAAAAPELLESLAAVLIVISGDHGIDGSNCLAVRAAEALVESLRDSREAAR